MILIYVLQCKLIIENMYFKHTLTGLSYHMGHSKFHMNLNVKMFLFSFACHSECLKLNDIHHPHYFSQLFILRHYYPSCFFALVSMLFTCMQLAVCRLHAVICPINLAVVLHVHLFFRAG